MRARLAEMTGAEKASAMRAKGENSIMGMDYAASTDWAFPIPIRYGPGRVVETPQVLVAAGGRRPLVVTDKGSADLEFVTKILDLLRNDGLEPDLYSGISPNPLDHEIVEGRKRYAEGGHDSVVALGGGSGMDGGKAISLAASADCDLWDFEETAPSPKIERFPPVLCIPTTAGTGAETESTSMVTHTGKAMKLCVWHPKQKPVAAILDPELTLGLPKNLTAWTGCDALVHAIEAYSVPKLHPLCDGIALEALRLIGSALPIAVERLDDIELRGRMLVGSCLAGIAFLKGLGLVHAISHMAGALYNTHHGLTNGVLLPAVLRFNAGQIKGKVPWMARALGAESDRFDGLYEFVCALLDRLEIPTSLSELGVEERSVEEIAAKAMQDVAAGTNPRPARAEEMESLVRETVSGAR